MERSSIAKPIHPVLKACSIVAEMGPHELLHFVVEVVYLIQKIAFALHSAGFVACVEPPAFEGVRVDDGVVALVAVVERTFGCPPFFLGASITTPKKHPSFANGVSSRLKSRLKSRLIVD